VFYPVLSWWWPLSVETRCYNKEYQNRFAVTVLIYLPTSMQVKDVRTTAKLRVMLRQGHAAVKCDAVYSGEILHQNHHSLLKMRTSRFLRPPHSLCHNTRHHIPEDSKHITFLHITYKIFGPKYIKSHVRPKKTLHCRPPNVKICSFLSVTNLSLTKAIEMVHYPQNRVRHE